MICQQTSDVYLWQIIADEEKGQSTTSDLLAARSLFCFSPLLRDCPCVFVYILFKKEEEEEPMHTHTHIICFIFSSKRRYKTNDENNGGCLKYLRRAESQLTFLSDSYHRIYIYRICSRVGLARNVTWLAPVPQAHPTEGKMHTQ